jgi:hypothetical protein
MEAKPILSASILDRRVCLTSNDTRLMPIWYGHHDWYAKGVPSRVAIAE